MTINEESQIAGLQRRQRLMAAGGLLGALAASSCCILPLILFGLGVSGAWIGNFTQLAPYQPYFIRHSPDDSEISVDSSDFAASLEARREMWLATSSFGQPERWSRG